MTMGIDRRRFLGAGAGLAAGLVLPARALGQALPAVVGAAEGALFAAACKDAQGQFAAVIFDADTGRDVARVALPARGHDIAQRPDSQRPDSDGVRGMREVVAFARRPGNFAVVFGPDPARQPLWFTSRADRYFYGHGVFSGDGRLLYTTENDFEAGVGTIGVRDATAGYKQIGELGSGGIGPHDLALLADGQTLVVANGGIKTHPDTPRLELNLATMQPSLAYIDTRTGDLLERHELPAALHQLSIRHLAVGANATVLFGCQFNGPGWQTQNIVGRHRRGQPIELLALPDDVTLAMRNYVASLCVDPTGETAVIAAPRGGLAVVVDVRSGRYLARHAMPNVFGVAARRDGSGFLMSSGNGQLAALTGEPLPQTQALARAWDNHLVALS